MPAGEDAIREQAQTAFGELWKVVGKLNNAVKNNYRQEAGVTYELGAADGQTGTVEGLIAATKGSASPPSATKVLRFKIQGETIWFEPDALPDSRGAPSPEGIRFEASEQRQIIDELEAVLARHFD